VADINNWGLRLSGESSGGRVQYWRVPTVTVMATESFYRSWVLAFVFGMLNFEVCAGQKKAVFSPQKGAKRKLNGNYLQQPGRVCCQISFLRGGDGRTNVHARGGKVLY